MNKVLIIEDEVATATPVKEALMLKGVDADIAKNGVDGVEMCAKGEYDLVLLDLKMPGMDGEQALINIRKDDPFVDVIIYTNYSEFTDIKKLTNIGIQGYVNKGPNADLTELLDAILGRLLPLSVDDVSVLISKTPIDFFDTANEG